MAKAEAEIGLGNLKEADKLLQRMCDEQGQKYRRSRLNDTYTYFYRKSKGLQKAGIQRKGIDCAGMATPRTQ